MSESVTDLRSISEWKCDWFVSGTDHAIVTGKKSQFDEMVVL